jgi:hypothetical protein
MAQQTKIYRQAVDTKNEGSPAIQAGWRPKSAVQWAALQTASETKAARQQD